MHNSPEDAFLAPSHDVDPFGMANALARRTMGIATILAEMGGDYVARESIEGVAEQIEGNMSMLLTLLERWEVGKLNKPENEPIS